MLSGRLISNSFPEEGLVLPQTRKSFDGSVELILDIGLVVHLDVKRIANVELNGDFGSINSVALALNLPTRHRPQAITYLKQRRNVLR